MSQGLAGRLAGEWAAVSIAARELRLEEVFGIIHGSFEPILLAMVRGGLYFQVVVLVVSILGRPCHVRGDSPTAFAMVPDLPASPAWFCSFAAIRHKQQERERPD